MHCAGGRHPVPDLRPHRDRLAHGVCPVAARLASPSVGSWPTPWSWPSALHPTQSPGRELAPPAARTPSSATPASGRELQPGPTPRTRTAAATRPHSPSTVCVASDATATRGYDQVPPSAGPAGTLGNPEPGGARRAPARRARSPGP
ncbi:hypothetical protein NN561_009734 [Cricetulus griseus]